MSLRHPVVNDALCTYDSLFYRALLQKRPMTFAWCTYDRWWWYSLMTIFSGSFVENDLHLTGSYDLGVCSLWCIVYIQSLDCIILILDAQIRVSQRAHSQIIRLYNQVNDALCTYNRLMVQSYEKWPIFSGSFVENDLHHSLDSIAWWYSLMIWECAFRDTLICAFRIRMSVLTVCIAYIHSRNCTVLWVGSASSETL